MVLPKMGASYVIKKFADEVMAEPKAAVESAMATALDPSAGRTTPATTGAAPQPQIADAWDGQEIQNEDGDVIGTARRVRQVGLYIISDGYGDLSSELESLVLDDESRRFFVYDDKGRVAGLIYAPHPDKMPVRAEAFRADDI